MLILLSVVFGWGLGILSAQVHHFLQGPLKIAVRAIGRSPHCHITPLVSVAVTLMALLMATTLRGSFLETLQIQRLEADGNYIFTGLPEYKKSQFIQFLNDKQIELKGIYPTVQANLIEINGLPIDEALDTESDTREQIRSKVRLSWAEKKPENNTLIQGQWPARKSREVSVEQEVMSDLNLKIGDVLGFQIGNKVVRARIASARKYNGQSSSMMFWFMFAPDALENYKHRYMGGLLLKENVVAHLSTLVSHFPQIRITNLERQMSKIRELIAALIRLMNTILSLLLGCAALLIITSSFVGAAHHKKQLGLLRTFGLKRNQAYLMAIVQQLVLGSVACAMGIVGTQVIAGLMFQQLFTINYALNWPLAIGLSVALNIAYSATAFIYTYRRLQQTPRLSLT